VDFGVGIGRPATQKLINQRIIITSRTGTTERWGQWYSSITQPKGEMGLQISSKHLKGFNI